MLHFVFCLSLWSIDSFLTQQLQVLHTTLLATHTKRTSPMSPLASMQSFHKACWSLSVCMFFVISTAFHICERIIHGNEMLTGTESKGNVFAQKCNSLCSTALRMIDCRLPWLPNTRLQICDTEMVDGCHPMFVEQLDHMFQGVDLLQDNGACLSRIVLCSLHAAGASGAS